MLAQPVSPPSSGVCKPTKPTIAQINRRVALARERAQKAVALADTAALNENAQLVRAGVKRTALVSVRMSSKGFGDKDPRHALEILRLLSVDAMEAYTFAMLGLTSYKYHVSTLAAKLVDASLYRSYRDLSVWGSGGRNRVRVLVARSERDGRPGCTLSGSPDAMVSPEERNAATVGGLLSLPPPRDAREGGRGWG
jgi:hypothetical protein